MSTKLSPKEKLSSYVHYVKKFFNESIDYSHLKVRDQTNQPVTQNCRRPHYSIKSCKNNFSSNISRKALRLYISCRICWY